MTAINYFGHIIASRKHKANTQVGSGYSLQTLLTTYSANTEKRISASISNAALPQANITN